MNGNKEPQVEPVSQDILAAVVSGVRELLPRETHILPDDMGMFSPNLPTMGPLQWTTCRPGN